MAINVGDKIPTVDLSIMTADGPEGISTDDIFGGKKVAIFGLPGAFTPTCSAKHLPGFVNNAEALNRLARGMIKASRSLHDDYATFRQVYDSYVTVPLPDQDVESIWQREHQTGGFAVNGEMSAEHWNAQLDSYVTLDPDMTRIDRDELLAPQFVSDALTEFGRHAGSFDRTGA